MQGARAQKSKSGQVLLTCVFIIKRLLAYHHVLVVRAKPALPSRLPMSEMAA